MDEREFFRRNARLVEEWENTPRKPDDLYSDMTREEVIRLSMYQQELLASREQENKDLHDKLDSVLAQLTETNATLACLTRMLADKDSEIKALMESKQESDSLIQALTEQLKRGNKDRFGSKSQKGSASAKAKKEERSHQQDKDDFDGTSGSIGGSGDQISSSTSSQSASKTRTESQLTADMLRRGSSYRHSKADFLAHLAVNRFVLDTPLYREMTRLEEEGMRLSRKTLTNWLYKGSLYLTGMVEELKKTALVRDSIVNCDETWCRVKVQNRYRRRYIWCLVNKEARIVIYCYEDGSRGRDVLRNIIGGAEIKALQSDGYNVYMYLDKEMIGIDHLCCMAHARAKFKYACEISGDEDARYMLSLFAQLYAQEDTFKKAGLTPEQIRQARRLPGYLDIIGQLRSKLETLTADVHPPRGELMEKAIRYLDTFWKQLFRYLDDGRYSIDNNIAERNIRPLAGERKNSLFFGSHKMARASAIYHTAIATCRMTAVSVMEYFKTFFRRIIEGVRDYSLLMPQTIGICVKNA